MSEIFEEYKAGWRDLLGATIGLGCGVAMYTPVTSMFFRSIEQEFHWSKTAIATSLIALPITAVCLPITGRIIDRYGPRRTALISAVLMALSFVFLAKMTGALLAFSGGVIAFNVLGSATGPICYMRPVTRSFTKARGAAIGIALSGVSLAGIFLAPLLGPVLARGGWRTGYLMLAAVGLFGGLVATLLIRPRPPARGGVQTSEPLSFKEIIKQSAFWRLGLIIFAVSAASVGFVSQLQNVAIDYGVPLRSTAPLLAILALSVFFFRIIAGWCLDCRAPELAAGFILAFSGLGLVLWLAAPGSFIFAILATIALGVSVGAEHGILSFFCARIFGLRHYSSVFGMLGVFLYLGMAAGGVGFAAVRDMTGSYRPAILGAIIVLLASGGAMYSLANSAMIEKREGVFEA